MFLLDINVWLAMTFAGHSHQLSAVRWFDSASESSCSFCRMTQQGFLRIATNPKAFPLKALPLIYAWQAYDALLADSRVAFAEEPPGLEQAWRNYTQMTSFSPKVWNDAYLAAFTKCSAYTFVTFDKGFGRYRDVPITILS